MMPRKPARPSRTRPRKKKKRGHVAVLRRPAKPFWADYEDEDLLDLRICDLGLRFEGTEILSRIERLYDELAERGLKLRPHIWFSSEWFSPDGVPGIAVPYYLGHERLTRLEEKMMLKAEGGGERECMRILRHEMGHVICSAYRLHFKPSWRSVFGKFTERYPDSYVPKPKSRRFVQHLDWFYAQAHPAEDFAETFAVWLTPYSRWKQQYANWPALKKIEYVDELMSEIAGAMPVVRSRMHVEPVKGMRVTLRDHYRKKQQDYETDWPDFYDRDLRRIFSEEERFVDNETAAAFLRRSRSEIRDTVADWTGAHPYTIEHVLRDMIDRCKELKLRVMLNQRFTRLQATLMITVQSMKFLQGGGQRIVL
ncbi:MAG: putative zinc-binding metallopeptidase [Phycisphaeraceae bacterium]